MKKKQRIIADQCVRDTKDRLWQYLSINSISSCQKLIHNIVPNIRNNIFSKRENGISNSQEYFTGARYVTRRTIKPIITWGNGYKSSAWDDLGARGHARAITRLSRPWIPNSKKNFRKISEQIVSLTSPFYFIQSRNNYWRSYFSSTEKVNSRKIIFRDKAAKICEYYTGCAKKRFPLLKQNCGI